MPIFWVTMPTSEPPWSIHHDKPVDREKAVQRVVEGAGGRLIGGVYFEQTGTYCCAIVDGPDDPPRASAMFQALAATNVDTLLVATQASEAIAQRAELLKLVPPG